MAWDVGNQADRSRLHKAIKTNRDLIESRFRKPRTVMIREYVGSWYSPNGAPMLTYVNMLNRTAHIYTMALAFSNPQCKVTSFDPNLWPFCRRYEVNINKVIANINFKKAFREGLLDAFFLVGVFKVRMADAGYVETEDNIWVDPGQPWVDRISFDDVILDLSARSIERMRFIGDRYRVSLRKVLEREDFDAKVVKRLSATSKYGHDVGSDYVSEIGPGRQADDDELEPMVWLEDVFLPETQQLVTFSADDDSLDPLKVTEWGGSPRGPYKVLSLGMVPDNVIPTTPAQNLLALHQLANRLWRKLSQQAAIQKNIVGFSAGAEDDALRLKEAKNGEYVKLYDPKNVVPINFPGVDGNTNAFLVAMKEDYNTAAGNERALGGLGEEAHTLGQEQLIQGHASNLIADMKSAVNDCASEICREIGSLMWDDDFLQVQSSIEVEHTGRNVDSSWRPGHREGLKDHYDFNVEPNSMGFQSPEMKLQKILGFVQSVGTVWPLVQAGVLDIQELTKLVSEYQNVPELQRVFKFVSPQQMGIGSDPHEASKPPVTSRETVRNNVSRGPQGEAISQVMSQLMQSRGPSSGVTIGGKS